MIYEVDLNISILQMLVTEQNNLWVCLMKKNGRLLSAIKQTNSY